MLQTIAMVLNLTSIGFTIVAVVFGFRIFRIRMTAVEQDVRDKLVNLAEYIASGKYKKGANAYRDHKLLSPYDKELNKLYEAISDHLERDWVSLQRPPGTTLKKVEITTHDNS